MTTRSQSTTPEQQDVVPFVPNESTTVNSTYNRSDKREPALHRAIYIKIQRSPRTTAAIPKCYSEHSSRSNAYTQLRNPKRPKLR
jgi:hypothetical protein